MELDCSSWARKCYQQPLASENFVIHFGSQTIPLFPAPSLAKILQNNLQTSPCLINSPWCISLKIYSYFWEIPLPVLLVRKDVHWLLLRVGGSILCVSSNFTLVLMRRRYESWHLSQQLTYEKAAGWNAWIFFKEGTEAEVSLLWSILLILGPH